jgi:hypothetical protein
LRNALSVREMRISSSEVETIILTGKMAFSEGMP